MCGIHEVPKSDFGDEIVSGRIRLIRGEWYRTTFAGSSNNDSITSVGSRTACLRKDLTQRLFPFYLELAVRHNRSVNGNRLTPELDHIHCSVRISIELLQLIDQRSLESSNTQA